MQTPDKNAIYEYLKEQTTHKEEPIKTNLFSRTHSEMSSKNTSKQENSSNPPPFTQIKIWIDKIFLINLLTNTLTDVFLYLFSLN